MIGDMKIYEVELKAILKDGQIEDIEKILENTYKCNPEICVYHDTYFDTINKDLLKSEKELRLRKITIAQTEKVLLTYKEPPFENISKSKIEHEIRVSSSKEASIILGHLGYIEDISFQKECTNFHVSYRAFEILVTLVKMRELEQDFIEAEVLTDDIDAITQVKEVLHEFLSLLNITPKQLTNEYYTDMVRHARSQ